MASEQKRTLADLGDTRNPFWLKCHIDDRGPRWRLAHRCRMMDGEPGVQIIEEGSIDHFEDYAENYEEAAVVEILPPQESE